MIRIRYGKQDTNNYSPYIWDIRNNLNQFNTNHINPNQQTSATATTKKSKNGWIQSHYDICHTIITDNLHIRNHIAYILIVVFISITFADMVNGKFKRISFLFFWLKISKDLIRRKKERKNRSIIVWPKHFVCFLRSGYVLGKTNTRW